MSGEEIKQKLQQLGFPNAGSLDAQDLDWMFENESLQPVLNWFCQRVNTSNLLDKKEKEGFNKLSQSGEIILKGRQLDEALSNLECVQDETLTEESLKSEIQQLSTTVQHNMKKKKRLMQRRNLLSNHLTALSHRSSKLEAVAGNVKHKYKEVLEQTHADNAKMNDSLEKLTHVVTDMNDLYGKSVESQSQSAKSNIPLQTGKSCVTSQTGSPAMFLSQVPLQQYYNTEEAFAKQLTAFTRKQFVEGIAEMACAGSRYEILDVSDPTSLLVRGETDNTVLQDCKELARLRALHVKSHTDRLRALCKMKKVKSELQCAEGILNSLKIGGFSTETAKNKEKLQKLQLAVEPIKRDILLMTEKEIPKLLEECREATVTQVLTGDYNLKIARQDYFTSNQDKVINQLIIQRSRNEFLTMSLEVELRRHRELHHLLTSVYTELYKQYSEWQKRLAVMGDNSLTPARHKRETVDSRDKSTARICHMLDEEHSQGQQQLFSTYASLVENARELQQKLAGLESAFTASQSGHHDRIHTIEKDLKMCEELIYTGSSTTSGAPLLTPRPIQDAIIQLRDMLKQLEQGIIDVVKDLEKKKKLLKSDALLAQERKLFTYFFTNPAKLHQLIDGLSSRVQAEKHVEKHQ